MLTKRGGLIMSDNYEKAVNAVDLSKEQIEEKRFLLFNAFIKRGYSNMESFKLAKDAINTYLKLKEKEDYGGFLEDCKKALVGRYIEYRRVDDEVRKDLIAGITHKWSNTYGVVLQAQGEEMLMLCTTLRDLIIKSWGRDTYACYKLSPRK